ncbi:MAG: HlyD family efflux transporter periplasmic adaptor subunit, partial [Pseudomonadota bacterium]
PLPRPLRRRMILYAYATWIYRFFLLLGIALIVYHMFFKALGVLLFVVELYFFIARPILREMGEWWDRRGQIMRAPRFFLTITIFGTVVGLLAWPFPQTVHLPALYFAGTHQDIYPQHNAQLVEIHVVEGQDVSAGMPTFTFALPSISAERAALQAELNRIDTQSRRQTSVAEDLANTITLKSQRALQQDRLAALAATEAQLSLSASAPGIVMDLNPRLSPGQWVASTTLLGRVVDPSSARLTAYITETDRTLLGDNRAGQFIPDDPGIAQITVTLTDMAVARSERIEPQELLAASGGPIQTLSGGATDTIPVENWFRVTAVPDSLNQGQIGLIRGTIRAKGERVSQFGLALRQIARVLVREAGL